MWQRFTQLARMSVVEAQMYANGAYTHRVDEGHILRGILEFERCVAVQILCQMGVELFDAKMIAVQRSGCGDRSTYRRGRDNQFSWHGKKVFDNAYDAARSLNNNFIGTEHLLLGLTDERCPLAGALASVGVTRERVLEGVRRFREETSRLPA